MGLSRCIWPRTDPNWCERWSSWPRGGILTAAAILILSVIMRRGSFGKSVGTLGVVTGALGIVSEALQPMLGFGYLLYGLLLPTWFALVGWKLLRLDRRDVA